jgi:hypothetical protein
VAGVSAVGGGLGLPSALPRRALHHQRRRHYLPRAARDGDFGSCGRLRYPRVSRLVPAYYVALLIWLVLLATVDSPGGRPGLDRSGSI